MQVMVFISPPLENGPNHVPTLLVLPSNPKAVIPRHLQMFSWSYFADTDSEDHLIGGPEAKIAELIERDGYAQVPTPKR